MSKPLKTDDLIALIAADARSEEHAAPRALMLGWMGGFLASLALLIVTLGLRPDLVEQLESWRFLAKVVIVWVAVGVSAWDCVRLSRPTETKLASGWNWIVVALLTAAIALELTTVPGNEWAKNLIGENWPYCLTYIPMLAVPPLLAAFLAYRSAAPASPRAAAAALGRLAAATGAGLYALHCPDDSPLFVLTWYGIAVAGVTLATTLSGTRLLRW